MMQTKTNALKEAALFFGLTLGLSYFVFWGPLALFQIPTISFVSATVDRCGRLFYSLWAALCLPWWQFS
jgi:hypothetical protein